MYGTSRWMTTVLIVCWLLSGLPRAATAQDPSSNAMEDYRRSVEALRLAYEAEQLYSMGRYDEAIPLAERAVSLYSGLAIEKDLLIIGKEAKSSPYIVLAKLYRAKGDYARSEEMFVRLLKIIESVPGETSNPLRDFSVAIALNEFAALYEAKGDYGRALQYRARGSVLVERFWVESLTPYIKPTTNVWGDSLNRSRVLGTGIVDAEFVKRMIMDALPGQSHSIISLHIRRLAQDKQAAQLALTTILQRKGRVLDAMAEQLNVLRRYGTAQDQKLIHQLTKAYTRVAASSGESRKAAFDSKVKELQDAIARGAPTDKIQQELQQEISALANESTKPFYVQQELGELEGAIRRRSAELRKPEPSITLSAIQQALPDDAALVEIIAYQPFDAKKEIKAFDEPHYAAYVIRRNEAVPQWVELGGAASIDQAVRQLRAALRDPKRADVKDLARALDERVMRPVRKLLGPTRRIFLAPDGALNLIPFNVLVDEKNQYLIENYSINYLTSGRDLLRLQVRGESRDEPQVFANPLFDLTGRKPQSAGRTSASTAIASTISKDLKDINYRPLPGTAAEAAALGQLFPNAAVLTEERATEGALKSVNRPRLLHIATHGFFIGDQLEETSSSRFNSSMNNPMRSHFPLLRSGLVLAGVRQGTSGAEEDGLLTALEMVGMDLWGTKLVVLSACETGLGEVQNGEGVYGLRRALVLSGSETQIMSLWKVSDTGTRDLMVAYYVRLQRGASRIEAIRQVQLEMLRGRLLPGSSNKQLNTRDTADVDDATSPAKDYRHPYYWAAFIPSGDWRNMEGKEVQSQVRMVN